MPPRYVVLRHDAPRGLHWDFMLERAGVLATWALAEPPDAAPVVAATPLPDHRLAYLDHQGPISGDRGSVIRWDRGTYRCQRWEAEEVVVAVEGEILRGAITLRRSPEAPTPWTFAYVPLAPGVVPSASGSNG